MSRKMIASIIGIFTAVITAGIFVLRIPFHLQSPICVIACCACILSEFFTTLSFCGYKDRPIRYETPALFLLQLSATVVLSIIYIRLVPTGYLGFILAYLLSVILTLLIVCIIEHMHNVDEIPPPPPPSHGNLLSCRGVVITLLERDTEGRYRVELEKLSRDLISCDASKYIPECDNEMYRRLCEAADHINDPDYDMSTALRRVREMAGQRSIEY